MIRTLAIIVARIFYNEAYIERIGIRRILHYIFFQKILRIQAHVPWPVHWSSTVGAIDNITLSDPLTMPGYSPGCYINTMNGIEFGKNVLIGPGVKIISANHKLCEYDEHKNAKPIVIGDNCWIGANAIILPQVELGDHVVVGAGAVVTKSFKEGNCIIAGNPAKKVKEIGEYR